MIELLIGRLGWDYLRITALDRQSSNWFDATVEIKCGVWSGKYTATFENGELRFFASEIRALYQNLSGSASLRQAREPFLTLTCKGDGRGHISLTGVAEEHPFQGPQLTFQLKLEQTELLQIADSLEALDPQVGATQP